MSASTGERNVGSQEKTQAPIQEVLEIKQDGKFVLEALLAAKKTKHYNHLRFLSKRHLSNHNLYYTEKPFSFIFLIYHRSKFFVVWETYSTKEATYLWKLESDNDTMLREKLKGVIEQIKWLRQNNKLSYIAAMPINAHRIQHDYSGDDMGFSKWERKPIFIFRE